MMFLARGSRRTFWTIVASLCLLSTSLVMGKGKPPEDPPSPPEPTPAGTIYFQIDTPSGAQTWGMDGDGNNVFQALPQGYFGCPSSLLYGNQGAGRRWWLVSAPENPPRVYDRVIDADGSVRLDENGEPVSITHKELFAISVDENQNVTWQPVCDSFGQVLFGGMLSGQFNGQIHPDGGFRYQWSSEGLDLFAYGSVLDLRDIYVLEDDGTTTLDFTKGTTSDAFFRVDPAGGDMTLGQSIDAGSMGEITIVDTDIREYFQMAPDAQSIASDVMEFDPTQNGYVRTFVLYDATHENVLATGPREVEEPFRWSPLGGEIAYSWSQDGKYGIWLIPADLGGFGEPSSLFLFRDPKDSNSPSWNISDPRWSPDAAHLVFRQKLKTRGQMSETHLYRIKRDGTGVINLTNNLDGGSRKWPFRWVSNQFAP